MLTIEVRLPRRRSIPNTTSKSTRFCDAREVMGIRAPTVARVLDEECAIPVRRQMVVEGLLKRVARRIEDIVLSKIAISLVHEIYARSRFETGSGYGRRTTNVYVSQSEAGTMLVLTREDSPDYAISYDIAEYGSGHQVGVVDDGLVTIHHLGSHLDADGVVDAIIADVTRSKGSAVKRASIASGSFLDRATSMPIAVGATTVGGLGTLVALWIGLDVMATLAIASAATAVVSGRPHVRNLADVLSRMAQRRAAADGQADADDDGWRSLEGDIRDGTRLRGRYDVVRDRLSGSIDLEDVAALALMEGTLKRISDSHAKAMATASSVTRERAITAESRKALDHVIAAAEARVDLRSSAEMDAHSLNARFAIERTRPGNVGGSLH